MRNSNQYTIAQTSSRRASSKKNYFDWEIWLEDGDKPISEIDSVEYLLHSTFINRLRSFDDPSTKFKLKSSGWGEFMIQVLVYEKSGEVVHLNHWLKLGDNYSNIEQIPEEQEAPKKIFLSYSSSDAKFAKAVESTLIELGIDVKTSSDIPTEMSISEYIGDSIASSDAVVAIESDYKDRWQERELEIAKNADKQTFSISAEARSTATKMMGKMPSSTMDIPGGIDIKSLAENILKL